MVLKANSKLKVKKKVKIKGQKPFERIFID